MTRLLRLWRMGGSDLQLLWFALRHPNRPLWLFPVTAFLVFYAIEPLNFAIPLLGIIDDFVLLPLILHAALRFLPGEIRAGFGRKPAAR